MSISRENFLKTVYQCHVDLSQDTRPGTISEALDISRAATKDMARHLAGKGLLDYARYRELKLTAEGEKLALQVIRKHRLWEPFLFRTLNMSLHEIHREAEMLEHQTSDYLASRIAEYLDDPKHDPHGDPIPDANGEFHPQTGQESLASAEEGSVYVVARLSGTEEVFFDFCKRNHISPGSRVEVFRQYPEERMTEIRTTRGILLLHGELTKNIYLEKVEQE